MPRWGLLAISIPLLLQVSWFAARAHYTQPCGPPPFRPTTPSARVPDDAQNGWILLRDAVAQRRVQSGIREDTPIFTARTSPALGELVAQRSALDQLLSSSDALGYVALSESVLTRPRFASAQPTVAWDSLLTQTQALFHVLRSRSQQAALDGRMIDALQLATTSLKLADDYFESDRRIVQRLVALFVRERLLSWAFAVLDGTKQATDSDSLQDARESLRRAVRRDAQLVLSADDVLYAESIEMRNTLDADTRRRADSFADWYLFNSRATADDFDAYRIVVSEHFRSGSPTPVPAPAHKRGQPLWWLYNPDGRRFFDATIDNFEVRQLERMFEVDRRLHELQRRIAALT